MKWFIGYLGLNRLQTPSNDRMRIMRNGLVALVVVLCANLCLAATPVRPAGNDWPPVIGAWFWKDSTLEPDGFKPFLDAAASHSPYTLLTTSLRVSKGEITDPAICDQAEKAVRYANSLGLRVAIDSDIRLARHAFQKRYPDELQEELVLKIVELPANGSVNVAFEGQDLSDHMTGNTFPYQCLATQFVRAYSFVRGDDGIDPATVCDIPDTNIQSVADGPRKLTVTVPAEAGRSACVIVSHTYLTPDVFAPHLLAFQREIVGQYAKLPLVGIMKDEWGFPPDHTGNPGHDRYWYSQAMAKAYADDANNRDLVRDALLMMAGEKGRERDRQAAVNRYRKLCFTRNAAIEADYYQVGKEAFGPEAVIVTHATWTPYPGPQEFRKNGLDWWSAKRDIGQSDETTPYPCRTSLAKRWGYPVWYNQYYSSKLEDYAREFWAGALSGGRLNLHPVYPTPKTPIGDTHLALMRQGFMIGMDRLRMLDYITQAPLDCPVAVVFGHACAMNWAGPSYNHVGLEIASALCAEGYPTDLFPSSLVGNDTMTGNGVTVGNAAPGSDHSLRIDAEGYVCLGPQRYQAVVLYQPEFGDENELAFFTQAVQGKTAVFLVGDWTRDSNAHPLDAVARLGQNIRKCDDKTCNESVQSCLKERGLAKITNWSARLPGWGQNGIAHAAPPNEGFCTLTDGTYVRIAGAKNREGDPIQETFQWQNHSVTVDAIGVVGIRFDAAGQVDAFAAGGLKSLEVDGLKITLPERADLAFMRKADGKIHGVLQSLSGELPADLQKITSEWQRLAIPPRLPN
jgi:hypothetical protein